MRHFREGEGDRMNKALLLILTVAFLLLLVQITIPDVQISKVLPLMFGGLVTVAIAVVYKNLGEKK
jgi:hypothetical protein